MKKEPTIDDKIHELKKTISMLEWDISVIENQFAKSLKQSQLVQSKEELTQLIVERQKVFAADERWLLCQKEKRKNQNKPKTKGGVNMEEWQMKYSDDDDDDYDSDDNDNQWD